MSVAEQITEHAEAIIALTAQIPDESPQYEFRALSCRDTEWEEAYPGPFHEMNLNVMPCGIWSGTTWLKKRLDMVQEDDLGWCQLGNFTPNASGGSFSINEANCRTIIESVKDHPRNSHRYYLADEPNLTGMSNEERADNLDTIQTRSELIHSIDTHPSTRTSLADYRQAQLEPGIWAGVVDELWLSGYPSPNAKADPTRIADQARWCDLNGIDYLFFISAHDYQVDQPAYPTEDEFETAYAQVRSTKAKGTILYTFYDEEGKTHLRDNPSPPLTGWATVGRVMAP